MADIDFQGKHTGEEYQFHYHQHWIRLLWPVVKLCAWNILIFSVGYTTLIVGGIDDVLTQRITLSILTAFFLLAHFEFLARLYRYFLYVVIVTDKKVHRIKKTLVMIDDHQSLDLWMMQDINKYQHGIIQNVLGFGSITLEAQETILRLHFTPQIQERYTALMHLRERARDKMAYMGTVTKKQTEKNLEKENADFWGQQKKLKHQDPFGAARAKPVY